MKILEKELGKVVVDDELWTFLESRMGQKVNAESLPREVDYFDFNEHTEYMGLAKLEFPEYVDGILDDWDVLPVSPLN